MGTTRPIKLNLVSGELEFTSSPMIDETEVSTSPGADLIPRADDGGKIDHGWLPATVGNVTNPMFAAGDLIYGQAGEGGSGNYTNIITATHGATVTTNDTTSPAAIWDNDDDTAWGGGFSTRWVRFEWPDPKLIARYRIRALCENTLLLEASNDGTQWTTIHDTPLSAQSPDTGILDISNPQPYRIWRVTFWYNWGGSWLYTFNLFVEDGYPGAPARLPVGTTDQVLTVVDGLPAWADAAGGSGDATSLQGRTLTSAAPDDGDALVWNDSLSQWEPGTVAGGSGDATSLQGRTLTSAAPDDGDALVWNNSLSQWEPGAVAGGSGDGVGGSLYLATHFI